MRNVRKAAVAGITALALATSGLSAATADEGAADAGSSVKSFTSSGLGDRLGADEEVTGTDVFGWKQAEDLPEWARIWSIATVIGVIGSFVGLISIPIINDAKAKGFIK